MKYATLLEALEDFAKKQPEKLLIADETQTLSYSMFLSAVRSFACYLLQHGGMPGNIVAVQNSQTVAFAVAAFAVQSCGCACVPIDGDASQNRISQILNLTKANFAITRKPIEVDQKSILLDQVLTIANEQYTCTLPEIDPDQLSQILFTTGTTGASKGVMHTYRSELACAENQVHSLCADSSDVWLIPMPLSHAMGLRKLHGAILSGGSVVLTNGVTFAGSLFDAMTRYRVTILSLVPAYLSILLRLWQKELSGFQSQLKCIRLGSGAAKKQDLEQLSVLLPDVTVCICYGSSEASDCAYYRYHGKPEKTACVGVVNKNACIRLIDDSGEAITLPETPGRIELSGANLMCGYFNDPDLTASVLNNGRLISGDIGFFGQDGLLYLLGRADEVINSGGYKIAPDEIEEAARKINGIFDCACIAAPDEILGQIPVLAVQMQKEVPFSAESIYRQLSNQLEKHLLPRCIIETHEIPKTSNGKPQRSLLRKRLFPEES